ncbi:MAG: homocysteine S-methyltransferase family protein [Clostridia bacterium]|nr:homocysteine S-methyltransferase family protein [Clostridia bacterium]
MDFRDFLKDNIVCLDGGMGTLLQERGLLPGEYPERWNISHPEIITEIHKSYFDAGSNVVSTNTFGANTLKFSSDELSEIVCSAVKNARAAAALSESTEKKFVALDIGPTGKLLKPFGDLDFEEAVSVFAETVRLGAKCGVDLVVIETMNDSYETKAALLAVKENCDLPVIVTNAYGADGKLMTGATPFAMAAMLEGMGADAIGANCSLGPDKLACVARELVGVASVPVVLKPNAGIPRSEGGKTVFDVSPVEFSAEIAKLVSEGVRVVGGCCGTTPEYISALKKAISGISPAPITDKGLTVISSYTKAVVFGKEPILIGERINPTGKKRFKQALLENDMDYILLEGTSQEEKGVHVLDVNVGLPGIDEKAMLTSAVRELQAIIDLPLQIDTADRWAMEAALRAYNGKAMVNSVNGKTESMEAVFPLVKKYGGLVVALTLDENGIPETAEGRVRIAERIIAKAAEYGIGKKDLIFDTLAMTVSADSSAAVTTLSALRRINRELGCNTSLGVSNVSFGLPNRDAVNSTFFALALENGMSAAIMNPYSPDMMKTYYAYRALKGLDENCAGYIAAAESFSAAVSVRESVPAEEKRAENYASELQKAIVKGMREKAGEVTRELLKDVPPLDIVNGEIIPALNTVGSGFEAKTVYLPQLLMAAEAAKAAFESIKAAVSTEQTGNSCVFVLATVKGDIHDIGKNIVKLLLENYGFRVEDLGRDVPPEAVCDAVVRLNAPIVGLSALMTTTVPAMEETIGLLRKKAPQCKIVVGGAVLTAEYAEKIGADKYAKDAMETVRYAQTVAEE